MNYSFIFSGFCLFSKLYSKINLSLLPFRFKIKFGLEFAILPLIHQYLCWNSKAVFYLPLFPLLKWQKALWNIILNMFWHLPGYQSVRYQPLFSLLKGRAILLRQRWLDFSLSLKFHIVGVFLRCWTVLSELHKVEVWCHLVGLDSTLVWKFCEPNKMKIHWIVLTIVINILYKNEKNNIILSIKWLK